MDCHRCQSPQVVKNRWESLSAGARLQRYRCNDCGKRFNERTGTPMARLRVPSSVVATAVNSRTERMGARAAGRTFGTAHSTILRWEERLANRVDEWSPPALEDREVTLEGDEVYTRVGENRPPASSKGWTIHFGYTGHGMSVAIAAGKAIAEQISGSARAPIPKPFRPERFSLS